MNLYIVSPYKDFLSTLADFVINKFPCNHNLPNLKIILPTGKDCLILQKTLVSKLGNTFLPSIISITDILTEGEEAFGVPTESIDNISYLEYKILVSNVIQKFNKLKLNTFQSLECSSSLINLFDEFNYNYVSIEDFSNLFTAESAEHWQLINEFLNYAYYQIKDALKAMHTSQNSIYHTRMLEAEVQRLCGTQDNYIIIAGTFGQNEVMWNFLKNVALSERGYLILPPVPKVSDPIMDYSDQVNHPLYCFGKILKKLDRKLSDFVMLPNHELVNRSSTLDNLLSDNCDVERNIYDNKIEYYEFNSIFQEAEKISQLCMEANQEKIAIIINDEKCKKFYISCLNKHGLTFQDEYGISLLDTDVFQLIMDVSKILYTEFYLSDLFILLKNPILHCDHVFLLEKLLASAKKFTFSLDDISILIIATKDEQLVNWWSLIYKSLSLEKESYKEKLCFNKLLEKSIIAAESIYPNIWQRSYGLKISQFLAEVIRCRIDLFVDDIADFSEILKRLVAGAKLHDECLSESNITICTPENAIFSKYDLVILADFSEGSWPKSIPANPWLNRKAQEDLGCNINQIKLSASLYSFYLLLHNLRVVITRSTRQMNNIVPSSSFIMKLIYVSPSTIITHLNDKNYSQENKNYLTVSDNIVSSHFPSVISATDIETLIRNPYSFYLKKILQLKKNESVLLEPQLSDFGNFIHKVIEEYTKSYNNESPNKIKILIDIGEQLLKNLVLPFHTQKVWMTKLEAIAPEFIKFDTSRRIEGTVVYSEIKGKLKIKIIDQEIEIVSIADRIEIDQYSIGTIFDFKTGAIPSSIEVLSGLSPQLIVEALTLIKGGFGIKCTLGKLIYVKICSSEPYIKIAEMMLSKQDLDKHEEGLVELLTYYIHNKSFLKNIDLLKYNDYRHLARIQ